MKLKITQAGYTAFNGQLGDLVFANGESTTDASPESAAGIAAIYQVEFVNSSTDAVIAADDVTADNGIVENDAGDFNAATTPAPTEPA